MAETQSPAPRFSCTRFTRRTARRCVVLMRRFQLSDQQFGIGIQHREEADQETTPISARSLHGRSPADDSAHHALSTSAWRSIFPPCEKQRIAARADLIANNTLHSHKPRDNQHSYSLRAPYAFTVEIIPGGNPDTWPQLSGVQQYCDSMQNSQDRRALATPAKGSY